MTRYHARVAEVIDEVKREPGFYGKIINYAILGKDLDSKWSYAYIVIL